MSDPGRTGNAPRTGTLLAASLLLGLAAALIRSEMAAGLMAKFALSKLVYSTSDGAILFLLGFSALALWCSRLPLTGRSQTLATRLLGGGLVLGYGLHLQATLAYHVVHGVPWPSHVYHWTGGVNSYTALLHSHLGKSAMAALSAWLPARSHYDTGNAFAEVVPAWQAAAIAAGFLASSAGALGHMPALLRGYGRRPMLVALYLVAAATATKCILDGGVLAFAVPPALLLLASFVIQPDATAWSRFWLRRGGWFALGLVVAYGVLWLALSTGDVPQVGAWLFLLLALGLMMTGGWRGWRATACRTVLLAYLGLNAMLDADANLRPLLEEVGPRHRAAQFDVRGQAQALPLAAWQGRPVHALYRASGDDPWKPRRTLVWTQVAGMRTLPVSIRLLDVDRGGGELQATPSLQVAQIAPNGAHWIGLVFQGTDRALPPVLPAGLASVLSRNNYYVWLYQADLLLRRAGWTRYVLMPHTQGNAAPE